jgi:outer membrane autotransporter protein
VDSWQVGGYVSYFTSSWFLNAGGGIGDMNIESIRNIDFGSAIGSVSQVANAKYDGDITYFYGKGGYSFDLGNSGWKLSPELALSYVKVKQDGFSETGTGNAPVFLLNVDAQSVESLRGTAQLRLSKTFLSGNGGGWMPYARIGLANEFEDDLRPITAGFQGAPNTHFTVYGDAPRGTTAIFGLGVTGKVSESFSIYLDYSGEIGSDFSEHVISGGARFHF